MLSIDRLIQPRLINWSNSAQDAYGIENIKQRLKQLHSNIRHHNMSVSNV